MDSKKFIEIKKPVEEVRELKDYEVKKSPLSPAAQSKVINKSGSNYLSENEGYGPCKNTLCGCSCSSEECVCISRSIRATGTGAGAWFSGRKEGEGMNEELYGQASSSAFSIKDRDGEGRFFGGTASAEINKKCIKGKLSADLYNGKTDGVQVRVGPSVETGVSFEDGVEIKAVGFGFNVGKKLGISTPLGEISVDTEDDCVIQ